MLKNEKSPKIKDLLTIQKYSLDTQTAFQSKAYLIS